MRSEVPKNVCRFSVNLSIPEKNSSITLVICGLKLIFVDVLLTKLKCVLKPKVPASR